MSKMKQNAASIDDLRDLMRKLLVIELFKLDLTYVEIAKRLKMNKNVVTDLLKGIDKK